MAQTKLPAAMRKQQGFMKEASKRYNAADNIKGYAADGSPIHRVKWLPMVAKVRKEKGGKALGSASSAKSNVIHSVQSYKVGDYDLENKVVKITANGNIYATTNQARRACPGCKVMISFSDGTQKEYIYVEKSKAVGAPAPKRKPAIKPIYS
jgi:hypothetical protein